MAGVTSLDNYRPHMTVQTADGNVHVIPLANLNEFVRGERPARLIAGDASEEVMRALLRDYLSLFGDDSNG